MKPTLPGDHQVIQMRIVAVAAITLLGFVAFGAMAVTLLIVR